MLFNVGRAGLCLACKLWQLMCKGTVADDMGKKVVGAGQRGVARELPCKKGGWSVEERKDQGWSHLAGGLLGGKERGCRRRTLWRGGGQRGSRER